MVLFLLDAYFFAKVKFSTAHSDLNSICVNEVMFSVRLHVDIYRQVLKIYFHVRDQKRM